MPIPLYFITNCKDFVPLPQWSALPYSCGTDPQGNFRQPTAYWSGGPLLFDDAVLRHPTAACEEEILRRCSEGCILDFERRETEFHRSILELLQKKGVFPIWVPEAYATLAPQAWVTVSTRQPPNHWQHFCSRLQERYPHRWVLELQPLDRSGRAPVQKKEGEFYLTEACCKCRITARGMQCYDDLFTIQEKVKIAEASGCRGIIALHTDWPSH